MRDRGFASFLAESLEALRKEHPVAYARMCKDLAPREVALCIDGDTVSAVCDERQVWLRADRGSPHVALWSDWQTILDVIDAKLGLHQAIEENRICLVGEVDNLIAFFEGLTSYVHGAVRSPTFPALLRRYRWRSRWPVK